jgi:hypothetical protein
MTKSEEEREDSFWPDGEMCFREAPDTMPVYDLQVLEGGALRRQLRAQDSQELAPPVPEASRTLGI